MAAGTDTGAGWLPGALERYNKMHAPAGSPAGGQFAPASGSSSGTSAGKGSKAARPTPGNRNPVGQGETGKRVSDLQSRLNALGAHLKVDGIFGPKTLAAVRAFQRSHGLKADGLVGPKTTAALRTPHHAGHGKHPHAHGKAHPAAGTAPAHPKAAPAKIAPPPSGAKISGASAKAKTPAPVTVKPPPRGTEPEGDARAAGAVTNPGGTAKLHEYWVHGEGAAKVKWGTPGDFDRCVMHLGKFIADPKGYCAKAHHDALGYWPATHAKMEGKHMADQDGEDRAGAKKPYGNVEYADPKNGKYPIDTADHAKAAWSYINMPKNAAQYPLNGVTLAEVKARIKAACKKFGITISEDADGDMNAAHFAPALDVVRSGGGMELHPEDGTLGRLTGRFSEFGRWYKVSSKLEGDFMERVARGATLDTIRDNKDQMRVLFDHGMDGQICNKVLGPIDVLEEKSDGPWYEVPLFDTSYNRDLLPGLKAGVYGASMRMRVTGDKWDDKPPVSDANPDGLPERTITGMKVLEFGPVTFPANPGASAGVRSGTDEFYNRLRQVDAPAFEDAMRAAGLPLPPEGFTGRDGARSAPGGDEQDDVQPGNGGPSPTTNRAALRDRAWRMRRQLHG